MYRRILIPLDGSTLAEQALPHAIAQAERFQAELVLLRVLVPLPRSHGPPERAVKQAEYSTGSMAMEYLEHMAEAARERGVQVQVVTAEGSPHLEILNYAETNQVHLIVMSSRGQSGISRWLMGGVADRVVRGSAVPVLLVRSRIPGS
jgi:nucleotide-binding universal stress UspA family protein